MEPVHVKYLAKCLLSREGSVVFVFRIALCIMSHTGAEGVSVTEGVIVGPFLQWSRALGNWTYGTFLRSVVMPFTMIFFLCTLPDPLEPFPVIPKLMPVG